MPQIVITACTAFGSMTSNPTLEVTRRLVAASGNRHTRVVMPTNFRVSEAIIDRIVRSDRRRW